MEQGADGEERSPEEWAAEYGKRRGNYEEFARRLEALVVDLLASENIDVIQVESRAKTVASFAEKIRRKSRVEANPFDTVTDLVGVRIITYYLDDVSQVGALLAREFSIDERNSADRADSLASDQFGYRSDHHVATLTPARYGLIEWRNFKDIRVEFQVRTALQHAWAAVSHKLEYKAAEEAPAALRRRLFRLSALFELADEQFAVLRDERAETRKAYNEDVTEGRLDEIPIDTSSIGAYWRLSKRGADFRQQLKEHGFKDEYVTPVDEDRLARDRADLVKVLRACRLNTLADLDTYLSRPHLPLIMKALSEIYHEESIENAGSVDDELTTILIIDADKIDTLGKEIYSDPAPKRFRRARMRAVELGLGPMVTNVRSTGETGGEG